MVVIVPCLPVLFCFLHRWVLRRGFSVWVIGCGLCKKEKKISLDRVKKKHFLLTAVELFVWVDRSHFSTVLFLHCCLTDPPLSQPPGDFQCNSCLSPKRHFHNASMAILPRQRFNCHQGSWGTRGKERIVGPQWTSGGTKMISGHSLVIKLMLNLHNISLLFQIGT